MAKKKKIEKVTSITTADEYGNAKTIKLTGKTGGYTRDTTPALSAVSNTNKVQDIRTVKNEQNGIKDNDIRTIKTEDTQRNLKDAENNLNLKTAERQKKEAEIYEKAGQTFNTKFENPKTQTLTYDTKGQKKTALPEQKITSTQARKQLTKELGEEKEAYDQWKIANYENNLAKANEEDYGLWDKTLGNITRGAASIFSPLTVGEDLEIKDEQGNKTYLPSMGELRQQAIQNSYSDGLIGGIAKAGGDILYGGGKMLGAAALDIPTAGIGGKSLYWTSMALDNYKQNINDGYSKDKSLKNTLTNTAIQFISDRMLGGLTKVTTGGEISELERAVGNQLGKVMKDSVAKEYLSKMISEGASEGLEEILGAIADKVTLGKDIDIPDLIKRTAYSSLLGAGTAGFVNASMSLPSAVMQGGVQSGDINNNIDNTISSNEQIREINEIQQKAQNGEISYEQANQQIEQVQKGTYQQNQNLESIASQQVQQIQQAVQSGQMDYELANQQIQAINGALETEREKINGPVEQQVEDEKPKRIYNNKDYSGEKFNKYSDEEIKIIDKLIEKDKRGEKYTPIEQKQFETLERKEKGLKNPELNPNITKFDDVKSGYKYSKNFDESNFDSTMVDKAKEIVQANKQGRRTKQQWLDVAKNIGMQADNLDSKSLEKLAFESWAYTSPNQKDTLNRQGAKNVPFGVHEWVKAVYEGARVGQQVETKTQETSKVKKKLDERVSGDKLLDTQDFINEIKDTGAKVDDNGYVTVYHQTTSENAQKIMDSGKMSSKEQAIFFSTSEKASQSEGRGNAKLEFKIPAEELELDDLFDDNADVKIKLNGKTSLDVSNYLVKEEVKQEIKQQPKQEVKSNDNKAEQVENQAIKVEEKPKQEKSKSTDSIKEIRQEVEEKTNKTMSKHIETSSKATNTVEDIKNMNYDDIVYDTKTHQKSQEQALRELEGKDTDTNVNDIHAKFRGTERLTNVDSAKITELMKQTKALADEAAKNNNDAEYNKRMEQFRTLKGDYAVALSESGQFVEYAKVIKELDPETQIDVLKKVVEREQRRGNKKYEDVKINEELEKKYKEAKTDEERDAIMEEIKDDTARQIKITFADKANEFRFLSMLGNVKTHGRNIFGNVGMYSLQTFKDGVAAIGEDIYNKTSKNGLETRSKTLKPATKEVSKFVNEKVDSFMTDITNKYNEGRGMKGDLEGRTKKFSDNNIIGKALNKASDINSKALDFEDKFFSSKMTKQAMKGFLTANGIETNADIEAHPELVAQALDYALFKGQEATFHQDSTTATAIRNLRDKLYTGSGFSKLGGLAIDTTLPFVSTPANIAKNALEYTPIIGFGDINTQLKNAPDNMKANVFIDSLSKQFTGGALMAVGAYLASQGLVKGSGDDDKEDKTEASLGNASYSIKIGNSTYDLSWLSPTAIPFFEGVEVYNAFKKANSKGGIKATDTADLIDTMFGTLNPMTDMSVLQSIERVITSITYGGNAVKSATSTTFSSYLQQYIPTLLSQIAQVGDTKQRNTNTGANVIDKTIDQIKYKIPGARNTLPEKVDVWGNTNKTAGNVPQRMFEAFLSPANRKDYKVDKTTKELERLARETDDTAMLPTIKNKKLRVNHEDYDLKGKDYVDLQKTYGKTAKKNLDELIKTDTYKNADDTEKQSMVRKLYDYASYKAKEKYAKKKGIDFDSGTQTSYAMIDAFEIPYVKYVENKVSGNEGAAKMLEKLNDAGLSEAQKGAVMNYFNRAYYVNEDELYNTLENSDLSEKQKEIIKAKYKEYITDAERERYKRADNIGVDYDLYTNFRNFVKDAKGESRSGGLSKKQKVINWIQDQELTAQQKQNLYNDYINNQGIFSYYK